MNRDADLRAEGIEAIHQATAIYTADPVVTAMLERVGWPDAERNLIDPSCGDGAFLRRALSMLSPAPGDRAAALRIKGFEFYPPAAMQARQNIAADLVEAGWLESDAADVAESMVEIRDYLLDPPRETYSVTIGNPPYLRFARLPDVYKRLYKRVLAAYSSDVLHAFLDKCVQTMPPDGLVSIVSSDRWLGAETTARLRAVMGERVGLYFARRLDCSSSFYRAKTRVAGSLPRVHPVEVLLGPVAGAKTRMTHAPLSADGDVIESSGPCLNDIARVRIAPWMGPMGTFVVNEDEAVSLPREHLMPAIDTDDIDPATDALLPPRRFAILTSPAAEPTGRLREHILERRGELPPRAQRGKWWLPPETIGDRFRTDYLLVPRIARRLRVIGIPAGVAAINHNLSVVDVPGSGFGLNDLTSILLHPESQAWVRAHAPRLESGFYSITTNLLRRLPIPQEFHARIQRNQQMELSCAA